MSCRKQTLEALLVAVLLAPLAGCERATDFGPGVAARIGGRDVPYSAFESYVVKATGEQSGALDSAVLSSLFVQFLEQELLLRLAIERKLINGDGRASEAARRLLEEQPAPAPSEGGVAAYYRDHRSEFQRDERVLLRQVLLQDLETAERVRAELAAGVTFQEVARRYSTDQTAVFVGERGELQRSQLPVSFVEPIFALGDGETSEVLEADYGFHIFQVVEKSLAGVLPLGEVAPAIRERLEREAASALLESFVAEARARYNPQVAERNLPFAVDLAPPSRDGA